MSVKRFPGRNSHKTASPSLKCAVSVMRVALHFCELRVNSNRVLHGTRGQICLKHGEGEGNTKFGAKMRR